MTSCRPAAVNVTFVTAQSVAELNITKNNLRINAVDQCQARFITSKSINPFCEFAASRRT